MRLARKGLEKIFMKILADRTHPLYNARFSCHSHAYIHINVYRNSTVQYLERILPQIFVTEAFGPMSAVYLLTHRRYSFSNHVYFIHISSF